MLGTYTNDMHTSDNHNPIYPRNEQKSQRRNDIYLASTKENNKRIKLVPQVDPFIYQPAKINFPFYQICRMHNPSRTAKNNGKKIHEMRKLIYDQDFQLVSKKEALIENDKLQRFIDKAPDNKYTLYETYEITSIDLPSDLELYTANSQILNGTTHMKCYDRDDEY